jgi:exosortase E/protease (VPEID-CTERM system)
MTTSAVEVPLRRPVSATAAWWLGLGTLLLAEGLFISLSFDAISLSRERDVWFAPYLAESGRIAQGLVAGAALFVVIGGRSVLDVLRPGVERGRHDARWAHRMVAAVAQVLSYLVVLALTHRLFTTDLGRSPWSGWLALGWAVSGMLVLVFWGVAALPVDLWRDLLARCRWQVLASLVLGTLTAWGSRQLAAGLWTERFGGWTFEAVRLVLGPFLSDLASAPVGRRFQSGTFEVTIGTECSGLEGIGLVWAFLAVYLTWWRRGLRFPRVLLLVPVATLLIWLLNVARIATLVAIGRWWSAEVAVGGFHSQAGWLAFNAVAFAIVWCSQYVPWFRKEAASVDRPVAREGNPATPYLAPFLALVLATMVTTALTPSGGLDRLYPARVVAVALAFWWGKSWLSGLRWTWSWSAVTIGVLVFIPWVLFEPVTSRSGGEQLRASVAALPWPWALVWVAFRTIGSSVTVPLAEELAFRGFLLRRLVSADFRGVAPRHFTVLSFVLSSVLFGALHGRWAAGALAGMAYAIALYRRGELTDGVIAHAVTNALIAAAVLIQGHWSLWT